MTATTGRRITAGLAATVLALALIALASLPTGADRPGGVVGDGRLVAAEPVGEVEVLLVSRAGRLAVTVAYRQDKGWHGMDLPANPDGTVAAWTGTDGNGPVPALSVVYGRAPGDQVQIEWSDGTVSSPPVASDGAYLAARPGSVRSSAVRVRDGEAVVVEVEGP